MGLKSIILLSGIVLSGCAAPTIPKPPVYTGDDFRDIHYIGSYDDVMVRCSGTTTMVTCKAF